MTSQRKSAVIDLRPPRIESLMRELQREVETYQDALLMIAQGYYFHGSERIEADADWMQRQARKALEEVPRAF